MGGACPPEPLPVPPLPALCALKVVLNRALVEHAAGVRRASLLLKFPKDRMKRRRRQGEEDLDYLEKRPKSVQRRKANPEVRLADLLEKIVNTLVTLPEVRAGGGGGGGGGWEGAQGGCGRKRCHHAGVVAVI